MNKFSFFLNPKKNSLYSQCAFTPLEKAILSLMLKGNNNREIAKALFRSQDTIIDHMRNIRVKTNSKNKAEVIAKLALGE
jgi:DNA-binding CsgD family transcriptional regulator